MGCCIVGGVWPTASAQQKPGGGMLGLLTVSVEQMAKRWDKMESAK
jgi:hypothetical protein